MTHELRTLVEVTAAETGELLDYAYVADGSFLLLVALTRKGLLLLNNLHHVIARFQAL